MRRFSNILIVFICVIKAVVAAHSNLITPLTLLWSSVLDDAMEALEATDGGLLRLDLEGWTPTGALEKGAPCKAPDGMTTTTTR